MGEQAFKLWKDWRLHVIVLAIVAVTESIGTFAIPVGPGTILLLPMLYAVVIGLGLYFTPLVTDKQSINAEPLVFLSVSVLIAKFGVQAGPALPQIIEAGPALLLQEFGNLGTILLALPLAVFLGLKRESIGMTHSIGREANLALITDKYGLSSPEGRGVMAMYIFGTVFGSIFIGLISGFLATVTPLHPISFAMATGVGSGSMAAASLGPLIAAFPEMSETLTAFSGVSNLISSVTGLYMSIFIGLPLTVKLYEILSKNKEKKAAKGSVDYDKKS
ncbi:MULTISPECIES: DUF3100 domain-containing protein [Planococcus]|uniref:DUF3100 domain-containing protein n=2 Tax=Planococcus TaxID=1372 RepID=A0ABN4K0S4_9BACL|nr:MULTISPECIES: DUF3100 domain-containing protein [Planococcus]ALS79336.1 hypothetical protein AUO94_12075 [Planococcus kocurii]AQU78695.1 hypothetical protein AJGP001_05125 [Planococcus faecalis]KAA0956806.1 DUF3100 domain-containing protein [Planococcus sp. ANT_H30]MDJ0332385.1 DUF3100 domain-containing protein [Planococcus sp. S3-L1]